MIETGATVLYKDNVYRVRSVVDYRPVALALLNTGIYVPIQTLSKLDNF